MSVKRERFAEAVKWVARIIALPFAIFFFVFGVGDFVNIVTNEGLQHAINIGGLLGGVTIILALAGCIISWWWLLPAGVLLILAYLFGAISSGLVAVYHVGYFNLGQFRDFWSIPGIIYLVSGALLILSWRLTRKLITSARPPSETP